MINYGQIRNSISHSLHHIQMQIYLAQYIHY